MQSRAVFLRSPEKLDLPRDLRSVALALIFSRVSVQVKDVFFSQPLLKAVLLCILSILLYNT